MWSVLRGLTQAALAACYLPSMQATVSRLCRSQIVMPMLRLHGKPLPHWAITRSEFASCPRSPGWSQLTARQSAFGRAYETIVI